MCILVSRPNRILYREGGIEPVDRDNTWKAVDPRKKVVFICPSCPLSSGISSVGHLFISLGLWRMVTHGPCRHFISHILGRRTSLTPVCFIIHYFIFRRRRTQPQSWLLLWDPWEWCDTSPLAQRIEIFGWLGGRAWCAKSAPFWINYYGCDHCHCMWRALDLWRINDNLEYHVGSVGYLPRRRREKSTFWIIISEIHMQIKSFRRSRRAPCRDWTASDAWTACLVRLLLFDRWVVWHLVKPDRVLSVFDNRTHSPNPWLLLVIIYSI